MRTLLLALVTTAAAWVATSAPAQAQDANLPIPPQQAQPWTPPATKLPPAVVSATAQLFSDGLADPRGCEYREIEIGKDEQYAYKTNAWILPGTGAQQYAIGWDGLIRHVDKVGAPVNLDQGEKGDRYIFGSNHREKKGTEKKGTGTFSVLIMDR